MGCLHVFAGVMFCSCMHLPVVDQISIMFLNNQKCQKISKKRISERRVFASSYSTFFVTNLISGCKSHHSCEVDQTHHNLGLII
ncbi:hypothetical protein RSAG8_06300, partial [Rhizoctonia solani AG-8 WAC10335]